MEVPPRPPAEQAPLSLAASGHAEYDLTKRPAETEYAPGLSSVISEPYDPAEDREKLRGKIALALVAILAFIVFSSVVLTLLTLVHTLNGLDAIKSLLDSLLAPIVGLVGAVTGFYFGEKHK